MNMMTDLTGKLKKPENENWQLENHECRKNFTTRHIQIVDDIKLLKHEIYGLQYRLDNKSFVVDQGKRHADLGVFDLMLEECSSLIMFTYVMIQYENETGFTHPQEQLYVVTDSIAGIKVDVPFATTDTIRYYLNSIQKLWGF